MKSSINVFLFFLFPSQRDVVLSEPAIQVRRKGKGKQIWALEKMENRLVDMRELYQEWKDFDEDNPVSEYSSMQNSVAATLVHHSEIVWCGLLVSFPLFDVSVLWCLTLCQVCGYTDTLKDLFNLDVNTFIEKIYMFRLSVHTLLRLSAGDALLFQARRSILR